MDLAEAVREGSIASIRALLDAGADIRYVRPYGYTALIDVMFNRTIDGPELIPVVRLLIERGADLDGISAFGESALSVSSYRGKFEVVRLLLKAGANPAPLEWSRLHRAAAIGSIDDIRQVIADGADLSARDRWDRTPWLLSLQTRDLAKPQVLLVAGADLTDRGRCGKTPLMLSIESEDPAMLRWLLEKGIDPNVTDDNGETALVTAARKRDAACVRLLLDAGADALKKGYIFSPIQSSGSLEVARMLIGAGADPADMNDSAKAELTGLSRAEGIVCTSDDYQAAKYRVFGASNPEPMNFPFWKAMVRARFSAYGARAYFDLEQIHLEPVWCYERFGESLTELPDGRVIEIAGEHEDFYDADFCIYNDVIVHDGHGSFDIYGYPKDIFPPTDFHTATLVGNAIYVIGSLGYRGERRFGATQVYRLDIRTLAMEPVATTGLPPGWIHGHHAKLIGNTIEVTDGKVCRLLEGEEITEVNTGRFTLDLETMVWARVG